MPSGFKYVVAHSSDRTGTGAFQRDDEVDKLKKKYTAILYDRKMWGRIYVYCIECIV